MDLPCEVCDRSIIENKTEYNKYLATLRKENDISIYKKFVIDDVNLDDVDKVLNDYISIHNKKYDLYLIKCEFSITLDNFTRNIKTNYVHNIESYKIKCDLLYYIDCIKLEGYNFCNINRISTYTVSDRCNRTYEYYARKLLHPLETKLNIVIAKNPKLLDENINHILFRTKSHILFNIWIPTNILVIILNYMYLLYE